MNRNIVVVGGGASGLAAAIWAARQGAGVVILERMDRVGKKILSTGNGKCNLTNKFLDKDCYRGENPEFPYQVLERFGLEETLRFFEDIGIYLKDKHGYIYPYSEQASSVLDLLRAENERLDVNIVCDCVIREIKNAKKGFLILTSKGEFPADRVILAAGGKAAPVTGSDGSGYVLAKKLGHNIVKPLPALVQLRCDGNYFKQLSGIRIEALVALFSDGKKLSENRGELQLADYGISGIPVFQVSRYASVALDEGRRVLAVINFLPSMDQGQITELLYGRRKLLGHKTAEDFFLGLFPKKLGAVLLKLCKVPLSGLVRDFDRPQIERMAKKIGAFETEVIGTNPFASAQVCRGGVDTGEICPETMESLLVPGLYLAGEMIDVDGICGGYNLQWAWSSGAVAGMNAGRGKND